jgi:hypothetical protein
MIPMIHWCVEVTLEELLFTWTIADRLETQELATLEARCHASDSVLCSGALRNDQLADGC